MSIVAIVQTESSSEEYASCAGLRKEILTDSGENVWPYRESLLQSMNF